MTRTEMLNELKRLTGYIEFDLVTMDDQRAITACHFLRYYLVDHLTDGDFEEML